MKGKSITLFCPLLHFDMLEGNRMRIFSHSSQNFQIAWYKFLDVFLFIA